MSEPISFEALTEFDTSGEIAAFAPAATLRSLGINGFVFDTGDALVFVTAPGATALVSGYTSDVGQIATTAPQATVRALESGPEVIFASAPLALVSMTEGSVPTPTLQLIEVTAPVATAAMSGYQITSGDITLVAPTARSRIVEMGPNVIFGESPLAVVMVGETIPQTTHFYLDYPDSYMAMWVGGYYTTLMDSFGLSDSTAIGLWVWSIREQFALSESAGSLLTGTSALTDTVAFGETLKIVWRVLVGETLGLSDEATPSVNAIRQVIDTLVLADVASTRVQAIEAIAMVLALSESTTLRWHAAIAEAIALNETLAERITALSSVIDTLALGDTLTPSVTFMAVASDTLALGDTPTSQLAALSVLRESVALLTRITVNGETYSAWVINTESKGVTRYENFPFNSFAQVDRQYIGATRTGLYLLEGDDDDGTDIAARIRSGLSDLGTRVAKRAPSMFLGYRAAGGLVLKVITTSATGSKVEHWYELQERTANDVRESRFKIGRGIKSVYWGYELANIDGADFAIESIEWRPLALDRRLT